jgi:hypothetical protein
MRTASRPLVVGVYVDNLLIASPMNNDIDKFKQERRERFRINDLGLLSYYLSIEVWQNDTSISLY